MSLSAPFPYYGYSGIMPVWDGKSTTRSAGRPDAPAGHATTAARTSPVSMRYGSGVTSVNVSSEISGRGTGGRLIQTGRESMTRSGKITGIRWPENGTRTTPSIARESSPRCSVERESRE